MINRILIVTDAWEPQVNGVVRTLQNTIQHLRDRGMTVDVISPDQYFGINLRAVPGLRLAFPPYRMGRIADYDAVHIATEGPLGIAAKIHCDRRRYRYTTAYHTNFPNYLEVHARIPSRITYGFFRWFHAKSAATMVSTPTMRAELKRNGFANLQHWGRGVSEIFRPLATKTDVDGLPRPYWLSVGRVSREKNLDAFLALDLPGTKFVVGDGPDRARLEAAYPGVIFLGEKTGVDLVSRYANADVFVFPSRFDTFGLVMAEAISTGIPVAAFPVTGPVDVVKDGITGCLDEDLSIACTKALALGQVSDDFSWERATDQFYDNLVPLMGRCQD
jgi:glycosyltransferase involved in cell wall biosynthesis